MVSSLGTQGGSVSMNQGRMFLELKPRDERPPMEQVIQELRRAAGATPVKPPERRPWGQVVGFVRDPDGFLVEICTPVPPP